MYATYFIATDSQTITIITISSLLIIEILLNDYFTLQSSTGNFLYSCCFGCDDNNERSLALLFNQNYDTRTIIPLSSYTVYIIYSLQQIPLEWSKFGATQANPEVVLH